MPWPRETPSGVGVSVTLSLFTDKDARTHPNEGLIAVGGGTEGPDGVFCSNFVLEQGVLDPWETAWSSPAC